MAEITIEIRPFGVVTLKIWPALISDQQIVFAEVQDNPLCPLVSTTAEDAKAFGLALVREADSALAAAQGIQNKAQEQRGA